MVVYYVPSQSTEQTFTVEDETTECTAGQTLCQNDISYECVNGHWAEGGNACGVAECTAGQTKCENNISYVCSSGLWVVGGTACSSGCTPGATKCEGGYWWTCEGGVWTLTNIPCNPTTPKNYMPYLILGGIGVMAIAGVALIARRPRE